MSLLDRIVPDPAVRFGKPTVRGTRISVADVLGYLAGGMGLSVEDRITRAQRVRDSIAADPGTVALTPEQRAELIRRLEDHERDPGDVVGWDEAESRIRAQLEK